MQLGKRGSHQFSSILAQEKQFSDGGVKHHTVIVIAKSSADQDFRGGCIEGRLGL